MPCQPRQGQQYLGKKCQPFEISKKEQDTGIEIVGEQIVI
jgi:hypothetical protein